MVKNSKFSGEVENARIQGRATMNLREIVFIDPTTIPYFFYATYSLEQFPNTQEKNNFFK